MGKSRDALGLVLSGLRLSLSEGVIRAGVVIGIAETAQAYRTSATPVREALARLAGEGLLIGTRRLGFMRPSLDASELRELYTLHEVLVLAALRLSPAGATASTAGEDERTSAEEVFAGLVSAARNRPLERARRTTALALAGPRRVEPQVLGDPDAERDQLVALSRAGSVDALAEAVGAYHERRRRRAAAIVAADQVAPLTQQG